MEIKKASRVGALILALNLFSSLSFAQDDYVYFCVGIQEGCYRVRKDRVEAFSWKLASLVSGRYVVPDEEKFFKKAYRPSKTGGIEKYLIPHYRVHDVKPVAFEAIIRFVEDGKTDFITKENRELVLEEAEKLSLIELKEALLGRPGECPAGYVLVPGNPEYSTPTPNKSFCLMKYPASRDANGNPASVIGSTPWVNINRNDAEAACARLGAGHHLETNSERQVTARNIENTAGNWNHGAGPVGTGTISRGNSSGSEALAAAGDENPYFGTGFENDWTHKRTHVLSNGQLVWDLAGNMWQWVSGNLTTTRQREWQEFNSAPMTAEYTKQFGPQGAYTSAHNMGKIYMYDAGAVLRGGYWDYDTYAGIFASDLDEAAAYTGPRVGFRCALSLPENR